MRWQWIVTGGGAALSVTFVLAGPSQSSDVSVSAEPVQARQTGPPPVAPSPNVCVPGSGSRSWCGDGRAATAAKLAAPRDVTVAPDGTLFIADTLNNVIRRVTPDGIIATVAGDGVPHSPRASEPAATAGFDRPEGVAFEEGGSLLVADTRNNAIRRVAADGVTTIVVGGPTGVVTRLRRPRDVVALPGGGMLVVDSGRHQVLQVSSSSRVRRVAGTGRAGFIRSSRRASRSPLRSPSQVTPLIGGDLLIADTGNRAIRVVSRGRLRTRARLSSLPLGVAASGARVLASYSAGVLRVAPFPLVRVAGTGSRGFSGDAGPPLETALDTPGQLAAAPDGTLLIAETGSDRIRRLRVGELVTVAGNDRPAAARAAAAVATARKRRCELYNPRFDPFDVRSVRPGKGKRVRVRYVTGESAKVVAQLRRRGRVRGEKRKHLVPGSSHEHGITVRATVRRGRSYRVALWGSSVPAQWQKCSFADLRVG